MTLRKLYGVPHQPQPSQNYLSVRFKQLRRDVVDFQDIGMYQQTPLKCKFDNLNLVHQADEIKSVRHVFPLCELHYALVMNIAKTLAAENRT